MACPPVSKVKMLSTHVFSRYLAPEQGRGTGGEPKKCRVQPPGTDYNEIPQVNNRILADPRDMSGRNLLWKLSRRERPKQREWYHGLSPGSSHEPRLYPYRAVSGCRLGSGVLFIEATSFCSLGLLNKGSRVNICLSPRSPSISAPQVTSLIVPVDLSGHILSLYSHVFPFRIILLLKTSPSGLTTVWYVGTSSLSGVAFVGAYRWTCPLFQQLENMACLCQDGSYSDLLVYLMGFVLSCISFSFAVLLFKKSFPV